MYKIGERAYFFFFTVLPTLLPSPSSVLKVAAPSSLLKFGACLVEPAYMQATFNLAAASLAAAKHRQYPLLLPAIPA
jgi:hypothetical protein